MEKSAAGVWPFRYLSALGKLRAMWLARVIGFGGSAKKEAAFSAGKRRRPTNAVGNGRMSGDTSGGKNFPPETQPADTHTAKEIRLLLFAFGLGSRGNNLRPDAEEENDTLEFPPGPHALNSGTFSAKG